MNGVREMKWFGSDVWPAADHVTFWKVGTTIWYCCSQEGRCRNYFESRATSEVWKAVSSRLIGLGVCMRCNNIKHNF